MMKTNDPLRQEIEREALESAAKLLENFSIPMGDAYSKAFKLAVRLIRAMKP